MMRGIHSIKRLPGGAKILVCALLFVVAFPAFSDDYDDYVAEFVEFIGHMEQTLLVFGAEYVTAETDDLRLEALERFVVLMTEIMAEGRALEGRQDEFADRASEGPPPEILAAMESLELAGPVIEPIFEEIMEKAEVDERYAILLAQLQEASF